jgi:hypothetical protein
MTQGKAEQTNLPLRNLLSRIDASDRELASAGKQIASVRRVLKAANKGLSSSPYPIAQLQKVAKQLRTLENLSLSVDIEALTKVADAATDSTVAAFRPGLHRELRAAAEVSRMSFEIVGDVPVIGTFEVQLDPAKGQAALVYGKSAVLKGLPADAGKIVAAASKLSAHLFDDLPATAALAADFEEAVMIALTRAKTSLRTPELRAELPAVYREMTFIRQNAKPPMTSKNFREYSAAKFVVELATLVRSDENVQAERPFRLETAVIENAGNRRKSVFVPRDLHRSFGEGMYFQAIVQRQQT